MTTSPFSAEQFTALKEAIDAALAETERYILAGYGAIDAGLQAQLDELSGLVLGHGVNPAPSDAEKAHDLLFEFMDVVLDGNPSRAMVAEKKHREELAAAASAVRTGPRIENEHGWQIITIDEGADLLDPRQAAAVRALIAKTHDRYIYARMQLLIAEHQAKHPQAYGDRRPRKGSAPKSPMTPEVARANFLAAERNYFEITDVGIERLMRAGHRVEAADERLPRVA